MRLAVYLLCATSVLGFQNAASAATLSYVGNLNPSDANNAFLTSLNLVNGSAITIQTYGYGGSAGAPGGTVGGSVIPAGGFAPFVALYSGTVISATLLGSSETPTCPPGTPKQSGGSPACFDVSLMQAFLGPGSYVLAVGVRGNEPNAVTNGTPTFAGHGSYIDPGNNDTRLTSQYAVTVTLTAVAPEPGAGTLLVSALGVLLLWRSRSRRVANVSGRQP